MKHKIYKLYTLVQDKYTALVLYCMMLEGGNTTKNKSQGKNLTEVWNARIYCNIKHKSYDWPY